MARLGEGLGGCERGGKALLRLDQCKEQDLAEPESVYILQPSPSLAGQTTSSGNVCIAVSRTLQKTQCAVEWAAHKVAKHQEIRSRFQFLILQQSQRLSQA